MQYVTLCAWLLPLSMFSWFLPCYSRYQFFTYYCTIFQCIYTTFSIHSSGGNSGCLFFAAMNNAFMNIWYKFLYGHMFYPLEYMSRNKIAELYGNSVFDNFRNCQIVFQSEGLQQFSFLLVLCEGFNFFAFSPTLAIASSYILASNEHEVISHYGFDFHIQNK